MEGSITHYSQCIQHCTLHQLWKELKVSCNFLKARREVDDFNSHNRWKKRGVAMVPTKFMNQVRNSPLCTTISCEARNRVFVTYPFFILGVRQVLLFMCTQTALFW